MLLPAGNLNETILGDLSVPVLSRFKYGLSLIDPDGNLGLVVQSWVSANPGLKFNPLFQFLYFYPSVSSKTLGTKTSVHIDKISEEIFPGL